MRRAAAISSHSFALPRGRVILGLALAAWGLVILASQSAMSLFALIAASL